MFADRGLIMQYIDMMMFKILGLFSESFCVCARMYFGYRVNVTSSINCKSYEMCNMTYATHPRKIRDWF